MPELKEKIEAKRSPKGVSSDWLIGGVTREAVLKDMNDGSKILQRLQGVLDYKFQIAMEPEYDTDASERERAVQAGYRKCLKDIYRLLQLDN